MSFDQLFMYVYRRPYRTLAIVLAVLVLLYYSGILYATAYGFAYVFSSIFGFIWNHVLPWPDCYVASRRNDLDVCAGLGVIYAPLTLILTSAIMLAGVVLAIIGLRRLIKGR